MKMKIRDIKFQPKTLEILEHIQKVISSFDIQWTVRQIHYRLVALDIIENIHENYRKISRITTAGRYAGVIDWDRITDETRNTYKTRDWKSIEDAIKHTFDNYRHDRWINSKYYVEVAIEKRTMINTFYPTTNEYDVHLNVGGGWNSTSNIWNTVRRLYERSNKGQKKIVILYFGDLDPSGSDMTRDIEDRLNEFGLNVEIKRILINIDDVEKYRLAKKFDVPVVKGEKVYNKIEADPRAKKFYDKFGELFQVEVEGIDPKVLIERLEQSIKEYVDLKEHKRIKKEEKKEVGGIKKKLGWIK